MTGRQPKYAERNAVEFTMSFKCDFTMAGCPVLSAVARAALGVIIAPPAIADAGCDSVSATRFFFDLTE